MLFFFVIALFSVTMFLCLIYSIPIIFVKQFHHRTHMLTFNICLTMICFGFIHIVFLTFRFYYTKVLLNNTSCNLMTYLRVMITFQLAFALVGVSIYRYGCVLYHSKTFFRSRKWLIVCIASQWIIGVLLPLALLSRNDANCSYPRWVSVYTMIFAVVISSLISLIVNIRIFFYGHSSSRRMQVHILINRIQPSLTTTTSNRNNMNNRSRISRRDIRLLKHMIYMFLMFIIGWGPFYTSMIFSHNMEISTFVYGFFCVWAQLSLVCLIITMFIYNTELRKYLVTKFFQGF